MTDEAREAAFEAWAAGIIYNNQPLPERKGIPYFLASKAYAAGVAEGLRQAREAVKAIQTESHGVMRHQYYPAHLVIDALAKPKPET